MGNMVNINNTSEIISEAELLSYFLLLLVTNLVEN